MTIHGDNLSALLPPRQGGSTLTLSPKTPLVSVTLTSPLGGVIVPLQHPLPLETTLDTRTRIIRYFRDTSLLVICRGFYDSVISDIPSIISD